MSIYEQLFRNALFPAYETYVKRRSTATHMAEYERNQWLPPAEVTDIQLRKLNLLLEHCWRHVPFLRSLWEAHGVRPERLTEIGELGNYPVLTKAQITANYEGMISVPWRGRTLTKTTGGSTGEPFRFEYTMDVYARRTAVMWRGYGWAGASLGTRTAYLWGTGMRKGGWGGLKDRLYHGAFNRHFIDAFSMSDANIDSRIEELVACRPEAVVGYVAPVVLVARRMLETGRRIEGVRSVLTGAEALHSPERDVIGRAFNCPVFNTYGAREVMLMAAECECRDGLHVNADHMILETLQEDHRTAPAGASGEVAITDLHNFGMPMVRYLNGDRATYALGVCRCGRGLPRLSSIDGRVLDLIETPDGRRIPGEFFVYAMLDSPDVKQWQVVQTDRTSIEFRLVVPVAWSQSRRDGFVERIRSVVGTNMCINIVEVDLIPVTASGKRRLTIALSKTAHEQTLPGMR